MSFNGIGNWYYIIIGIFKSINGSRYSHSYQLVLQLKGPFRSFLSAVGSTTLHLACQSLCFAGKGGAAQVWSLRFCCHEEEVLGRSMFPVRQWIPKCKTTSFDTFLPYMVTLMEMPFYVIE
jgi:hypothetical protein